MQTEGEDFCCECRKVGGGHHEGCVMLKTPTGKCRCGEFFLSGTHPEILRDGILHTGARCVSDGPLVLTSGTRLTDLFPNGIGLSSNDIRYDLMPRDISREPWMLCPYGCGRHVKPDGSDDHEKLFHPARVRNRLLGDIAETEKK